MEHSPSCALLADRHHRLIESVRDLLEASFDRLFIVADGESLFEGTARLQPAVVIVDLAIVPGRMPDVLRRVRNCSPRSKIVLLSVHDQASVARVALEAGADAVVLKRMIATDLLLAVDAVLADGRFVSPGIKQAAGKETADSAAEQS